jgi:beta-glucosidase
LDGHRLLSPISGCAGTGGTDRHGQVEMQFREDEARPGKQVIQIYLARSGTGVDRLARWLAAATAVRLAAVETPVLSLRVPRRAFANWQVGGWRYEAGASPSGPGTSVLDLPLPATIDFRDE